MAKYITVNYSIQFIVYRIQIQIQMRNFYCAAYTYSEQWRITLLSIISGRKKKSFE